MKSFFAIAVQWICSSKWKKKKRKRKKSKNIFEFKSRCWCFFYGEAFAVKMEIVNGKNIREESYNKFLSSRERFDIFILRVSV